MKEKEESNNMNCDSFAHDTVTAEKTFIMDTSEREIEKVKREEKEKHCTQNGKKERKRASE